MNKFFLILSQAFMTKLKSKAFIIITVILLLGVLGMTNMGRIMDLFGAGNDIKKIAVIDETGGVYDLFKASLKTIDEDVHLTKETDSSEEAMRKNLEKEKYDAYLIIEQDKEKIVKASYKAEAITDTDTMGTLQAALQGVKSNLAANQLKLAPEQLLLLNEPVQFDKEALSSHAKSAEELNQARGMVYILLFIIYFAVIFYANMIGMEVATEKSSRVMEILISSAPPLQHMFGKIIGVAMLGLAQMGLVLTVGYISLSQNYKNMKEGFFEFFGFGNMESSTIIYAIVFFLLGYLLYSTFAAFLGSLVSRIEDMQQMIMPMTFLIMIGFFISMYGLGNPSASFITITSYIPFFTPMIMFMRIGMLDIPTWEALTGIAVLVAAIIALGIFGARVYRGGVLMYGKSNSYKDIRKALQLTKNQ
ncbi:ABC transporter permease [Falsibacillus pallidus]|uniref:ABC-2 type transport system permease protein n=1 Tax=Falsibacillus pallidus TaxID=493781 RepID=A0A370GXA0_9BACI|nr:ABC transporter permease [Falsibacillus pallidus]RDI47880.1 ABC-2 type transport system permease protein [Falsibacillus pallidus]